MNAKKKLAAPLLAAILVIANMGIAFSGHSYASAQTQENVNIRTSVEDHDNKFFGEGVVRVLITDKNTDNDDDDIIVIEIEAESEHTSGYDSKRFTIPNTNPGSQRFEFFITHAGSQYADGIANDGTELDAANNQGFDDLSDGFDGVGAPIIRFGVDSGSGVELETGDSLYTQVNFEVRYESKRIEFSYDQSDGLVDTDRDTYGSDSFVYIRVQDQDANLNPTEPDRFNITDSDLDSLFELSGARFVDDIVFEETSDNGAIFEARLQLVSSDSESELAELERTSTAVSIVLRDAANYAEISAPENDAKTTSSTGFTIDNVDGVLEHSGPITFGSELQIVLRDNDQNKDSDDDETLIDVVRIKVGAGDSNTNGFLDSGESDEEKVGMEETEDNSGTFVIDAANNELRITFLADDENPVPYNGVLELRQGDIDKDISISYEDALDDDSSSSVTSRFTKKIQLVAGEVRLPEVAGINDEVVLSLTDPDLNNNPRTRDSYSLTLTGSAGTFELKRGGKSMASIATVGIEIGGALPRFASNISYVLTETDVSSGVFNSTLELQDILASAGVSADDGDRFEVKYTDKMARTSRESTATLIIQRSSIAVDFSRDVLPIPPEDDPSDPAPESSTGHLVGTSVMTTLIVTDVRENMQSNSENSIAFRFRNDPGTPRPAFSVRVEGEGFTATIDAMAKYNGSDPAGALGRSGLFLSDILPELPTLRETGKSTGAFDAELEFVNDGTMETQEWHDLTIEFSYLNDVGEDDRAGIVFRGNSGFLSADKDSVMAGTEILVTIQDEDLNLDDAELEEFRTSLDTNGAYLLAIEPEDDDIGSKTVRIKTFKETGPDSGVFTASFVVGSDVPVAEQDGDNLNQASIIHIEYNDEIDSSGRSGDEIEVDLPVMSGSGSTHVMPELIGPGTRLKVIVIDNDLNMSPLRSDRFEGDNEGDGIVSFRTDRKDAGRASPDLKETGPNTGVFEFELELVPIKDGEDGQPIEVDGGSKSRIGVLPGDLLAIRYEDESDGNGNSVVVSTVIDIMSWDPLFASDKDSYEENDRVTITIADADANRNPDIADSIRDIRVYSEMDRVGRTFSALETGKDSGVFRMSFLLNSGAQSGAIPARNGNEITISYEDEFPADYAQKVEDREKTERTFLYSFIVGLNTAGAGSTSPSIPTVTDVAGNELSQVRAGTQIALTTTIRNNNALSQPFLVIIEVRDSQHVTESLTWQTGTLNPSGSVNVGTSWLPENAGTYEMRTFVISALDDPLVLSPVVGAELMVH